MSQKRHTHTKHTHTHTNTDIHSDKCNRQECHTLHFALKSVYRLAPYGYLLARGSSHRFLTPFDIMEIDIARPLRVRRKRAYRPEVHYALANVLDSNL